MEQKKVQPGVREVVLTDLQIHAITPVNPQPLNRQVDKAIKANRPGRAYTTDFQVMPDGKIHFSFPTHDPDGTEVKYFVPKDGLKVYLSKDAIDKLKSLEKNKGIVWTSNKRMTL